MALHTEFLKQGVEELKKLPTWGKVSIAGLFLGVAAVGYWEYRNQGQSSQAGTSTDTTGTASQYPTVPGGSGNVPVLPGGISPVYDSSGSLVAFGPTSTPTATTTTTTTPTPDAVSKFSSMFGLSPEVRRTGSNYYLVQNGKNVPLSSFFPKGTTFSGSSTGTAYATLPGGAKQVISQTHYGTSTPAKSGGPPIPSGNYFTPDAAYQQRYHTDENGHIMPFTQIMPPNGSNGHTQGRPRIMPPQIKR